jgi:hypothetical protein
MNERIRECWLKAAREDSGDKWDTQEEFIERFARLIVKECIEKIETHRIPVGNSAAGEMACEWTYEALKQVRDEIKDHFGVEE